MTDLGLIPNCLRRMRDAFDISDSAALKIAACLQQPLRLAKKQTIICEGTLCGRAFFIESGMTRSYWIVDGEDVTTSFSTEGTLVFSMDELYYSLPSEEVVETIERSLAFPIAIHDLKALIRSDIEIANWWGVIHQNEYRRLHRSHKEQLTLPAPERYEAFARQFPEVCRRARLADIASYLGITPSTLSRIRAQWTAGH